ncbi:GNAT family N-acetyltransferase [Halobacillus karajensis]|uniref:N-acetyltransferase domain-containing protein n=1 Tax=Halobacillus karajensis TaxID=195088 RepID=A0A024P1C2_9BACI|nr:GNAT family protein [Halobacillus karajensis]CDQ19395.1 hypothetical protein BN982_01688 [Halobacillus karajensis]CDQ21858.1 hypothetical protein BN983_00052 [Halobacillus karajensis]CDQ27698.1 hypothetical protein BN981_01978 [Halobacillus karajensis]
MNISVKEMTEERAIVSLQWKYEPPYDFYNVNGDGASLAERLDGTYKALFEGKTFIGFFCIGEGAKVPAGRSRGVYQDEAVDMGLGMDPALTGKGKGTPFCSAVLSYIKKEYPGKPIRLSVATFNRRAIQLYKNMGFVKKDTFYTEACEFITMVKVP